MSQIHVLKGYYSDDCTYSTYRTLAQFTDELVAIGVCENLNRQRVANPKLFDAQEFCVVSENINTSTDLDPVALSVLANAIKLKGL